MKKEAKVSLFFAIGLLALFIVWTALVSTVDVQPIGPENSEVGFATFNGYFHSLTGVHLWLYELTDLLSIIPLLFVIGFACLGLFQLIKSRKITGVDYSILALGGFYIAVFASFLFFETFVINYRPILIEGVLEASYPSSTTMLAMTIMPTAIMQLYSLIKNKRSANIICAIMIAFSAFMVIGRIISGVHWITDIIGGALLSAALVMLYWFACNLKK